MKKNWLGILAKVTKKLLTAFIVVSITAILLHNLDTLEGIAHRVGYKNLILLIFCWSLLALASPFCTIYALKPELLKAIKNDYYDIAIRRLLAKYIPGGIWMFVGKGIDLHEKGLSASSIKAILIFEGLAPLIAAVFTSALAIMFLQAPNYFFAAALLTVTFLIAKDLVRTKVFKHHLFEQVDYVKGVLLVCVYWSASAGIFGLYYFNVDASCNEQCSALAAAYYVFSWAVGYIVPFAPQGLGISELTFSLVSTAQLEEVLVIQLLGFRLIVLFGDITAVALRSSYTFLRKLCHPGNL